MQRFVIFVFVLITLSCQEEINPLVKPITNNPGGGNGGNNPDETPVSGKYASCLSVLSDTTIDIVTWNIEQFPKEGTSTINLLKEMMSVMDADIIAVQEINSQSNFNSLVSQLPGYAGKLFIEGSLGVGYIYKTEEITSLDNLTLLFSDDSYAFPRPAVLTTATHVSGQELKLINIHLKCCDDGNSIDRRLQASVKLKNYIDQNLSNASVIVLGDYNEDLTQPEGNNVLTNFINDAADYRFADLDIAEGSSSFWSYPSWPSHLDHILITNELFDQVYVTKTVRFSFCEGSYFDNVSDHYPVMLRLTTED